MSNSLPFVAGAVYRSDFEVNVHQEQIGIPRLVISKSGGAYKSEFVYGNAVFEKTCDPYKYDIDHESYFQIFDNLVDGIDSTALIDKVLHEDRAITFVAPPPYKDVIGKSYSSLENAVLKHEKFDGFVDPSKGTVFRAMKAGYTSFKAYYTSSQVEKESTWRDAIKDICLVNSLPYVGILKPFTELPKNEKLFFGSNGWKIHNSGLYGVGLEFNPNVAKTIGVAYLDHEDHHTYFSVRYSKNRAEVQMRYDKRPIGIREHGSDYLYPRVFLLHRMLTCLM